MAQRPTLQPLLHSLYLACSQVIATDSLHTASDQKLVVGMRLQYICWGSLYKRTAATQISFVHSLGEIVSFLLPQQDKSGKEGNKLKGQPYCPAHS